MTASKEQSPNQRPTFYKGVVSEESGGCEAKHPSSLKWCTCTNSVFDGSVRSKRLHHSSSGLLKIRADAGAVTIAVHLELQIHVLWSEEEMSMA